MELRFVAAELGALDELRTEVHVQPKVRALRKRKPTRAARFGCFDAPRSCMRRVRNLLQQHRARVRISRQRRAQLRSSKKTRHRGGRPPSIEALEGLECCSVEAQARTVVKAVEAQARSMIGHGGFCAR